MDWGASITLPSTSSSQTPPSRSPTWSSSPGAGSRSSANGESRVPPDLVVEILSPWSVRRDRRTKAKLYARFGIPDYWVVDPEARTLEFHEVEGAKYRLVATHEGDEKVRTALFPGLTIDLGSVWE